LAKPYHHGDVEAAALSAALTLLEEAGADQLSLRRVAETIGTTHRALYRYFDGKAGLMEAIICEGFRAFERQLKSKDQTPEGFATTYTAFAQERPALYVLMMATPPGGHSPAVAAAYEPVVGWMQQAFGSDDAAIRAWMVLHGGLSLAKAGMLRHRSPKQLNDFLIKLASESEA